MKKRYFVSGIGTNVGKTIVSALLCEYLKADYFKPIQTGFPPDRDSYTVKQLVSYPITVHPENYLLSLPASPHIAANRDNIQIDINKIKVPETNNNLIIEGAGGLLAPINDTFFIADLISKFNAECILVVSDYLGCINHSLLSLYYILNNKLPFKGIILNGNFDELIKQSIIKNLHKSQIISHIPYFKNIDKSTFQNILKIFRQNLSTEL